MKEGLLERIREHGHWRVNFRPAFAPVQPLSLRACQDAVEQSSVSIRGWDFPHISRRTDDEGGSERTADYVGNWTDWSGMIEFWRMYRSSQFLSYVTLREDTHADFHGNPPRPILNFIGTIYSLSEFFEFAHRLWRHGFYVEGVNVSVSLMGIAGRVLEAGRGRIPFYDNYTTNSDHVELSRFLDPDSLENRHRDIAADAALELFDVFGWNPDISQIRAEQERFFERKFAY